MVSQGDRYPLPSQPQEHSQALWLLENALMMVIEYVPRGNLKDLLHGSNDPVSFGTRLRIAIDCAEALTCMHSMYQPIIHGDIKPENILLDDNLVAKLSDFGISRLVCMENTYRTMHLIGSRGYMDPEHLETGRVDPRNDVYSFGVLLLELVTREMASQNGLSTSLVRNFLEASLKNRNKFFEAFGKKKRTREMFDIQIKSASNLEVLDKFGELAVECLGKDFRKRPEMKLVLEKLRMLVKDHEKTQDGKEEKGQGVVPPNGNTAFSSSQSNDECENGRKSDGESHHEEEEEVENQQSLAQSISTENGPLEPVHDMTRGNELELSNQRSPDKVSSKGYWRLVTCQNGLHIYEELKEVDEHAKSYGKSMKAVGVVEASCEAVFKLLMSMDATRYEWDCSFQYGSLVEEVDGHTDILYHRLYLDWSLTFVWPRDLCYVRYWRRNDDGSYVVMFRSMEHTSCGPQPGFVRAHIESGGFSISPMKSRNGRIRTTVEHHMQIDFKGWGVGYLPSFQQHCLLRMLNSVSGLREWFSRSDEIPPILPKNQSEHSIILDDEFEEDDEFLLSQDGDS
ncbi:hypothetical protein ACQ4PT_002619 [Festuca glaucescens]